MAHTPTRSIHVLALVTALLAAPALTGCIGDADSAGDEPVGGAEAGERAAQPDTSPPPVELAPPQILHDQQRTIVQTGWFGPEQPPTLEEPIPPNATQLAVVLTWDPVEGCPPTTTCTPNALLGTDYEFVYVAPGLEGEGFSITVLTVGEHVRSDDEGASESRTRIAYGITTCAPDVAPDVNECDMGMAPTTAEAEARLVVEAWAGEVDLDQVSERYGLGGTGR